MIYDRIEEAILCNDASLKCQLTHELLSDIEHQKFTQPHAPIQIPLPGYPPELTLVSPKKLRRRGIQSQTGRNILLHAVAHIEFNAINLALDAAYRFRNQPKEFYLDWLRVADDEARHFTMIRNYLEDNDCSYGEYPAHNGLWDMATRTQHDVVARMALVPRVLEARGLDVTPGMINRLKNVGDAKAIDILEIIYEDEIGHVDVGSRWFFYQCDQQNLEPKATFIKMIETHMHGELRGPFNISARLKAGFDEMEMNLLNTRYG